MPSGRPPLPRGAAGPRPSAKEINSARRGVQSCVMTCLELGPHSLHRLVPPRNESFLERSRESSYKQEASSSLERTTGANGTANKRSPTFYYFGGNGNPRPLVPGNYVRVPIPYFGCRAPTRLHPESIPLLACAFGAERLLGIFMHHRSLNVPRRSWPPSHRQSGTLKWCPGWF